MTHHLTHRLPPAARRRTTLTLEIDMSAPTIAPSNRPTLTAHDHCDRCGARARVQVSLPCGGELLFCAHHGRRYEVALVEHGADIRTIATG